MNSDAGDVNGLDTAAKEHGPRFIHDHTLHTEARCLLERRGQKEPQMCGLGHGKFPFPSWVEAHGPRTA